MTSIHLSVFLSLSPPSLFLSQPSFSLTPPGLSSMTMSHNIVSNQSINQPNKQSPLHYSGHFTFKRLTNIGQSATDKPVGMHPAEARLNRTASLTAGGGGFSAKGKVCRIACKDIAVKISHSTLSLIFPHFIPVAKEAKKLRYHSRLLSCYPLSPKM